MIMDLIIFPVNICQCSRKLTFQVTFAYLADKHDQVSKSFVCIWWIKFKYLQIGFIMPKLLEKLKVETIASHYTLQCYQQAHMFLRGTLFRGGYRIFLGGGALISCSSSTPINHIVFFSLQNTSCIRKPQVISGGVRTPCTLPLDPPLLFLLNIGKVIYCSPSG